MGFNREQYRHYCDRCYALHGYEHWLVDHGWPYDNCEDCQTEIFRQKYIKARGGDYVSVVDSIDVERLAIYHLLLKKSLITELEYYETLSELAEENQKNIAARLGDNTYDR